jgi:hypothetical protein
MFFQWRQSAAGAEKFHSAMLPHAGTDTEVWRNTVTLGSALRALSEVEGSRVRAQAAIVFDYPAWWGTELDSHPSAAVTYPDRVLAHYRALWRRNITVDIVRPSADLSRYELVVVPALYLVTDDDAANIAQAAADGASVLVTYFSGIADEHDHIRLGGYPGAFRDLLGVRTEELWALQDGEVLTLDDGSAADLWSEQVHVGPDTEVVRTFADGDLAGWPALTRRPVGAGAAWYLATRLDSDGLQGVTDALIAEAGLTPVLESGDVEAVRRVADDGRSWLFVVNHTADELDGTLRRVDHELDGLLRLADEGTDELLAGRCQLALGRVELVQELIELRLGQRFDVGSGEPCLEALEVLRRLEAEPGELGLGEALALRPGAGGLVGKPVADGLLRLLGEIRDRLIERLVPELGERRDEQPILLGHDRLVLEPFPERGEGLGPWRETGRGRDRRGGLGRRLRRLAERIQGLHGGR